MAKRVTWAALEARLAGRPGWKRRGREYHGPCPVSREGRDTCWFAAGAVDAVRGGCRRCGGRLEGRDLAEHLAALGAREWTAGAGALRSPRPARRPARRLEPAPAVLPAAVWRAAVALKRPGLEYVARRLGCEPIVPAAVRWLPAAAAAAIPPDVEGRRPAVPGGAAGAVVYLFAGAGDSSVAAAVQLEAVDADGRRVPWGRDGVKRWSIPGSDFAGGGRVFVAAPGRPGCGAWVCEGPLDALAVAARVWPFLDGAAVLGVAGVSGFQPAAVGSILGPITLALQGDGDGVASGRVLERRLGRVGRSVRVVRSGLGGDWADPARGGGEGGVTVGEPSSVDRLVHAFDGLSVVDKRRFRRLQAQIDGEGEGAAPSSRGDMVGMLPAGLEPVVTRAMTADGSERLEAARVLAASEPWRRASAAERAIAAWAVSTFDGDAGGYLRAPPGLEHGLQAVLGALDRRSGRWVDPDGTAPAPVEPLEPAAVDWASPAPPRQWLLEGLLPAGRVSALYGPGESGKSRLTLQLALGVVGGADVPVVPVVPMLPGMAAPAKLVIPRVRQHGPVLMVTWEDETDEIRRRAAAVRATPGGPDVDPEVLRDRLRVIDMRAMGGPLWAPRADGSRHTSTEGEWTETGRRLLGTIERDRPALVVIDPIAAAYACSEVDRGLVRRFVGAVDAAAEASGAAVLLVGHPAKTGGDGYSGSTDWRNAVRGLLTVGPTDTAFEVDVGERKPATVRAPALQRDKSSYGPARGPVWLVSHYKAPSASRRGHGEDKALELCWFATDEASAARAVDSRAVDSRAVDSRAQVQSGGGNWEAA